MKILDFVDYRKYIKSWISKTGRGSLRRLSEHLRVQSTYLSQVISGTRDLNSDQALELTIYWQFTSLETEYFLALVEIEKAHTEKLKNYLRERRDHLKKESLDLSKRVSHDRVLTDEEKSLFYSTWIYSAVRAFTSIGNGNSADEISAAFGLPRAKIIEILQFLTQTGLCTEENGNYKPGVQKTYTDRKSPHTTKHHMNWRMKSMQRSENLDDTELMFTAPISISQKDFLVLREKIVDLINQMMSLVGESDPEGVACLNIDLIKIL